MTGGTKAPTRDEQVTNLLTNMAMIFASMFEQAFAGLATEMSKVTAGMGEVMANAMAQGLSGKPEDPEAVRKASAKSAAEMEPKISSGIKDMFSEIRKEISSKMPGDTPEFRSYLANPALDKGIRIVAGYDFGRPKLTERLSDEELASYLVLLRSGDEKLGKMFKELGEWQETLPKPPSRD
jgi:hypothetical protein